MSINKKLSFTTIMTAMILIVAVYLFLADSAFADSLTNANTAPVWRTGAVRTDTCQITCGNPYTPAEFVTFKWTDPDGDELDYYFSIDDGPEMSCAEYMGTRTQVQWFAYTFLTPGEYTIRVWASDGKARSEAYVADVNVVDPATHEYDMTILVAPKNANVKFYKCEGFDENGFDIPGEQVKHSKHTRGEDYHTYEISLKAGTYCFRGEDQQGNSLGGMTFKVPGEARIAGSSETLICLRQLNVACSTQYDGTNYCTEDFFTPVITRSGHKVSCGSTYLSGGMTYFRTMLVAASNDMTYQHRLVASEKTEEFGYTDGGVAKNFILSRGSAPGNIQLSLSRIQNWEFRVNEGARVRVHYQEGFYNVLDYTSRWLTAKEDNGDGTETWKFNIPANKSGLSWRVTTPGKLTRAGFFDEAGMKYDLTDDDKCDPKSNESTAAPLVVENSVFLNVSQDNAISLNRGDTFRLRMYRHWQIANVVWENYTLEPDFHTEVLYGKDVVSLDMHDNGNAGGNLVDVKALKEGTAIIRVTYDAIDVYGGDMEGIFGACDKCREGIAVIQVGSQGDGKIHYGLRGSKERYTEWDSEFDTVYFTGEHGELMMTPQVSEGRITRVQVTDDMEDPDWKTISSSGGAYTVPVSDGNNILKVTTSSGKIHYKVIRGARYTVDVTNVSRPGKEPCAGDEVNVHLNGLYMPVPKLAGLYNPGYGETGKAHFTAENGEKVSAPGVQYTFINKQDLKFIVPDYSDGEYTLSDGYFTINIMAKPDPLGWHREVTDEGLNSTYNAVSSAWSGCVLEAFDIKVAETGHGLLFTGIADGSEISLTNQYGNSIRPQENEDGSYLYRELPEGEYTYIVTNDEYETVRGSVTVSSSTDRNESIEIAQTANDPEVQRMIDIIKSLKGTTDLTADDIDMIDRAEAEYNRLTEEQRNIISESLTDKLMNLIRLGKIERNEDVKQLISKIKSLPDSGDITLEHEQDIVSMKGLLDALPEASRELITSEQVIRLEKAAARIEELKREKTDKEEADRVTLLITGLPDVQDITLSDKEKVDYAKAEYDKLTKIQKALIKDRIRQDLSDAVSMISALIKEQNESQRKAEEQKKKKEQERKAKIAKTKNIKVKLKAKIIKKKKVKVSWKKPSISVTGIRIYRSTKKAKGFKLIKTIKGIKKTGFTDKKVKKGRKYYYKARFYTVIEGKVYNGKWSRTVATGYLYD